MVSIGSKRRLYKRCRILYDMIKKENYKHIGHTGKPHGLIGELATKLTVEINEWIATEEQPFLMLEENGLLIPFRVEGHRSKGGDIDLIKFSGLHSKEDAEHWSNTPIWLNNEYLDDEEGNDPWEDYTQLIGYQIIDANSQCLIGTVISVDESTMNTLLVVDRGQGEEVLLPLAEELITALNEIEKTLILIIPKGLLDNDAEYDID